MVTTLLDLINIARSTGHFTESFLMIHKFSRKLIFSEEIRQRLSVHTTFFPSTAVYLSLIISYVLPPRFHSNVSINFLLAFLLI